MPPLATPDPDGPTPTPTLNTSVLPALPTIGIDIPGEPVGRLREVRFEGNQAFSDEQLTDVVRPYLNRLVGPPELITLRDQIAARYQTAGYLATRVSIATPLLLDGVLRVQVREGALAESPCVRILERSAPLPARGEATCEAPAQPGRLHPSYVTARLPGADTGALNINTLRASLATLQRDARVHRLDAALTPSPQGAAMLDLVVWEASPWTLSGELGNGVSPSLGSVLGSVAFEHLNLTGRGDTLFTTLRAAEGLITAEGGYSLPVLGGYTRLGLAARGGWSEVVEAPFDELDLTGRTSTFELRMDVPLLRTQPNRSLELGFALVQRSSSSFVFGDPFAFADAGENGAYRLSIVRASQSWVGRSKQHALALRSTISVGTGLLEASNRASETAPDGNFLAWRGQAQWARTLRWRGTLLLLRGDLQLAANRLFSLESFTLGGVSSVRGYRENQVIRDSGVSAGIEARIPVLERGRHRLSLALFSDAGRAWNLGDDDVEALWSVGAGLRWDHRRVNVSLYAGQALSSRPPSAADSLQDNGIHLSIRTAR